LLNQAFKLGEVGLDGFYQALTPDGLLHDRDGAGPTLDGLAEYLQEQYADLFAGTTPAAAASRQAQQVQDEAHESEARGMEELICQRLWGQLQALGFFNAPDGTWRPAGWPVLYERWLEETLSVLVGKNYLQYVSDGSITEPCAVTNGPEILATSMDVTAF